LERYKVKPSDREIFAIWFVIGLSVMVR
jgi:hypothetical protein